MIQYKLKITQDGYGIKDIFKNKKMKKSRKCNSKDDIFYKDSVDVGKFFLKNQDLFLNLKKVVAISKQDPDPFFPRPD